MVRESIVRPANFIYPLFIHDEVRLDGREDGGGGVKAVHVFGRCAVSAEEELKVL